MYAWNIELTMDISYLLDIVCGIVYVSYPLILET